MNVYRVPIPETKEHKPKWWKRPICWYRGHEWQELATFEYEYRPLGDLGGHAISTYRCLRCNGLHWKYVSFEEELEERFKQQRALILSEKGTPIRKTQ